MAHDLLGCIVGILKTDRFEVSGRIVETEAYLPDDPASHSYRGPTPRNASMFLQGGHAYVYRIYGIHRCLNVVTGPEGIGEAVLIRALEPFDGLPMMWNRRYGTPWPDDLNPMSRPSLEVKGLTNGPGKLAQALGISVSEYDGTDLCSGPLMICRDLSVDESRVGITPRIGLTEGKGNQEMWRWYIADSPYVSRRRRTHSRNAEWMRHDSSP